jgi:serine/threonine protein kinase
MPSPDEGTPTYMSPEHINAPHPEDIDSRADIYSLGIILFELLHPKCRPPFGGSENRIRECHLSVPAPYLKETDKGMADIIAKCLEKDPVNRYQTVWELLSDLDKGKCSTQYSADSTAEISPEAKKKEEARKSIQNTWEEANSRFSNGDLNGAMELTKDILQMQPNHADAKKLQEKLETRFRQAEALYEEIGRDLEGGDLAEIAILLQEANGIYPDHPSGRGVYARTKARAEHFLMVIEQGSEALGFDKWGSALSLYREANQFNRTSAQIKQIVQFIINYMNVNPRDTTRGRELCNYYFHQIEFLRKCLNQLRENLEEKLVELKKAFGK